MIRRVRTLTKRTLPLSLSLTMPDGNRKGKIQRTRHELPAGQRRLVRKCALHQVRRIRCVYALGSPASPMAESCPQDLSRRVNSTLELTVGELIRRSN